MLIPFMSCQRGFLYYFYTLSLGVFFGKCYIATDMAQTVLGFIINSICSFQNKCYPTTDALKSTSRLTAKLTNCPNVSGGTNVIPICIDRCFQIIVRLLDVSMSIKIAAILRIRGICSRLARFQFYVDVGNN